MFTLRQFDLLFVYFLNYIHLSKQLNSHRPAKMIFTPLCLIHINVLILIEYYLQQENYVEYSRTGEVVKGILQE